MLSRNSAYMFETKKAGDLRDEARGWGYDKDEAVERDRDRDEAEVAV
jgi:hypothetical protein